MDRERRRLILEDTGERRHPKAGELYRWLRGPHTALVARDDHDARDWTDPPNGYAILRLVEDGLADEVEAAKVMYALAVGKEEFLEWDRDGGVE